MISQALQDTLQPFLPAGIPWESVELRVGRIRTVDAMIPSAVIPRSVISVTQRDADRGLLTVGQSFDGVVVLDRRYAKMDTASGVALLGHELVHQEQYETIDNFAFLYDVEARNTPDDDPFANRYELPAYRAERAIYCSLVAQGWRPGSWVPLSVLEWGCPNYRV
jgi:hypothetical protein